MHITATCGNCQKKYKVDAQMGGKKAHCKNCGASFVIPKAEEAQVAAGDAGVAARAKPGATARAVAKAPRPMVKGTKAAGKAAPAPEQPATAPPPPEPETGEMDLAGDPPCPGCGKPLPPANKICLACGFNRVTGQKMQGAMTAGAAAGAAGSGGAAKGAKKPGAVSRGVQRESLADEDHDYRGFRLNKPYSNAFLNTVDTWVPKLAVYFIVLAVAGWLGLLWYAGLRGEKPLTVGQLIMITFGLCFFCGISLFVTLAVTNKGIDIGAKIMKCELPDLRYSRLMATYLIPWLASFVVLMVGGAGSMLLPGQTSGAIKTGMLLTIMGMSVVAFFATSFFTFMFFFRLKWLEALVSYAFFVMFNLLGGIVSVLVLWGIIFVLHMMGALGQAVTS